ncbi:carbon-nitrogen hydrolase family protein [Planctomycetota bacterium]
MNDCKVTVASLPSLLADTDANLEAVKTVCRDAAGQGSRLVLLPELMLTGHGGHPAMADNAEPVPDGPLTQAMLALSKECGLAISVGLAELTDHMVYNTEIVVDQGDFLGLQRKINMSGDEYLYFKPGEELEVFDLDDIRFGIIICYDNHFPELALALSLADVDLIHAPHAARTGEWPPDPDSAFLKSKRDGQQAGWEKVHRARAADHNCFVLLNNAVGPSTEGLEGVTANHAGTIMGIAPGGEVFLRSRIDECVAEAVTVTLEAGLRRTNHGPARNRRPGTVRNILKEYL